MIEIRQLLDVIYNFINYFTEDFHEIIIFDAYFSYLYTLYGLF